MTALIDTNQLIEDFAFLDTWEDRYAYVLELGRGLDPLGDDERNDATRVKGCVSQVWLITEPKNGDALHFRGDSDSLIVRGLIAILRILFSGKSCKEILATNPAPVLAKLGLDQHLSQQRANGLAAMITRIKAEAAVICDKA